MQTEETRDVTSLKWVHADATTGAWCNEHIVKYKMVQRYLFEMIKVEILKMFS